MCNQSMLPNSQLNWQATYRDMPLGYEVGNYYSIRSLELEV